MADLVHAPQVGVHHLVPLLHGRFPHRRVVCNDAGVVDQEVDCFPFPYYLYHYAGRLPVVCYVQGKGRRRPSCRVDFVNHLRQACNIAASDDNSRPFPGEGQGDGTAYAATGAGNAGHSIL